MRGLCLPTALLAVLAALHPRAAADTGLGQLAAELGRLRPGGPVQGWRSDQRRAREVACTLDGRHRLLQNVRWGFSEEGAPERWKPVFENTAVPTGQVKEAYLVLEPFKPEWLARHVMLAFRFNDGHEMLSSDGKRSKGLVFSAEAQVDRGQSYSLVAGMRNRFGLVRMLSSWEDAQQRVTRKDGNRLIRFRLNLSQAQRDRLLRSAVDAATAPATGDRYHTLRRSCYTEALALLNSVVPRRQRVKAWLVPRVLPNPLARLPRLGAWALRRKGLIDRGSRHEIAPAGAGSR